MVIAGCGTRLLTGAGVCYCFVSFSLITLGLVLYVSGTLILPGGGDTGGGDSMMMQSMGSSQSDLNDGSMNHWLVDTSDVGFTAIGGGDSKGLDGGTASAMKHMGTR